MLNGKSILITGGTGPFGKKFIEMTLSKYPEVIQDIDTMEDWQRAELMFRALRESVK